MSMPKKFSELRKKMPPERRRRNEVEAHRLLLEMNLQELRQQIATINQEDLAEILDVTQGYISKLEHQDDMLVSKLYEYIKALGGELEIRARFPNRSEVRVTQFSELEKLRTAITPTSDKRKAG